MSGEMVQTAPIHEVEQRLAQALERLHAEVLGLGRTRTHAHLRDDTLVYLVDGHDAPEASDERRRAGEQALSRITERILGRPVERLSVSRVSPSSIVAVVRLRGRGGGPAHAAD